MARTEADISAAYRHSTYPTPPALDDVFYLLEALDAQQQARPPAAVIHLSHTDYTTLVAGYRALWQALERAGLQLDRVPCAASGAAAVWFFRWRDGPHQGPFGTLDAAFATALQHIPERSEQID